MNQLLFVIGGWLGLLSRTALLVQIVVAVALILAYRAWKLRLPHPETSWQPVFAKLLLAAALAVAGAAATSFGQPGGLLTLVSQLVLIWALLAGLRLLLRRWQPAEVVESYWRRAVSPLFLVLGAAGLVQRLDGLEAISQVPLLKLFDEPFSFGKLLLLVALPYFLVVLSELPVALFGSMAGRFAGMDLGNRKAFELILRYLLIGVGGLWLADQIGLNGTAIAAIAGGLSVGLGFGIKEVFSNFVSGLWLLFEGSLKPGEVLVHDGDVCKVQSLGLRAATLLRSSDNAELLVPNQTFFTATTTTYTGTATLRCGSLNVRADYEHSPEQVIAILLEIAKANPRVMSNPPPSAKLAEFGDYAMIYGLDFWMTDPTTKGSIAAELRRAIWNRFHQDGIKIPRTLYQV
jgi:small-conductance mechanosensitive channel